MDYTEEEKKEIEKRHKELRRSMWEEKPPSNGAQGKKPEKVSTSSRATGRQSERIQLNAKSIARKDRPNTATGNNYRESPKAVPKTRREKQAAWQSNSATRSRQRQRWRVMSDKGGRFWNPPKPEQVKTPFRWKLALGVLGVVFALILVGGTAGYLFAKLALQQGA